ncbi:MAG TPA: hypothetical protein VFO83_13185, partial [Aggregicoccus sp.]|nr:hypothetical protein [Aggregicoccus sp.]
MVERAKQVVAGAGAARVFSQQPDRVAAAWRRVRYAEGRKGEVPHNLLDDVVEPFICELGRSLAGEASSAWGRTRGVLRLSPERGVRALYDEFAALRRCLVDALEVLGGTDEDRATVNRAVDEAVDSAVAYFQQLSDGRAEAP